MLQQTLVASQPKTEERADASGGWRSFKELCATNPEAQQQQQKQQQQKQGEGCGRVVECKKTTEAALLQRAKLKEAVEAVQTPLFSLLPPEG